MRWTMKAFMAMAAGILLLAACSNHATYSHHGQTARAATPSGRVADPVCGMEIDPKSAPREEYQGKMFYFCSEGCENEFKMSPAAYVRPPSRDTDVPVK
ncbi:MAG TPA: YHS domain-containing protein [Planctomycetota bacterium]|nr:YHS domain-containing protein [Planctomycetota bacterium]